MTNVTSFLVTGDWRTVIDDTPADPDPDPDIINPTGHVRFIPTGKQPFLAGGVAYTIGATTGLVADGQLRDFQGREGVHLAARIDGETIDWLAIVTLHAQGATRVYERSFILASDFHLTGDQP